MPFKCRLITNYFYCTTKMVLISLRLILLSRKYKKTTKHSHLKTTLDERQKCMVNDITHEKSEKSANMTKFSRLSFVVLMLTLIKFSIRENKTDRSDAIRTTLEDGYKFITKEVTLEEGEETTQRNEIMLLLEGGFDTITNEMSPEGPKIINHEGRQ